MVTSSIYAAISDENMPALMQWVKDGFADDVEDGGYTPILHAVEEGNKEVCKALIEAGVDVNALYESTNSSNLHIEGGEETRCTPLSLSIYNGNYDIAKMLIKAGADVNGSLYITIPDCFGGEEPIRHKTCFEMVVESGESELMDLFLAKGADPDISNSSGDTPIVEAIKMGDLKRFKNLLEWGADPAQSCDGWDSGNLISLAVEEYCNSKCSTYLEMIRLLIEHGGLTKLKYYNEHLLTWLFFEVNDPKLDELFDLDGIREKVNELEAETKIPSGLCPRTLLSPTDDRYREPRPCDISEIYYLALDKLGRHQIAQMMHVDEMIMESWVSGERNIPYPVWHLLIRIALSEGGAPAPV